MKTIKRVFMFAILVSSIGLASIYAQRGPHSGQKMGRSSGYGPDSCRLQLMVNRLATKLELTDQQEEQILQLHYAHRNEVKELMEENKGDCVAAKEARKASRVKLNEDVMKILDKEQYGEYRAMQARRKGRGANTGPRGRGGRAGGNIPCG